MSKPKSKPRPKTSEARYDDEMSHLVWTQCCSCVHDAHDGQRHRCAAFPDGIPDEIIANKFDHRLEVEGDHGIRFEPKPDVEPEALRMLYRALDALDKIPKV